MACLQDLRSRQLRVLLRHQAMSMKRRWVILGLQLLAPWLFIAMLLIVSRATSRASTAVPHPPTFPLDGLPRCTPGPYGHCVDMMYYPRTAETDAIAAKLAERAGWTVSFGIVPEWGKNIWGCESLELADDWMKLQPNTTGFAIGFDTENLGRYELWINSTLYMDSHTEVYSRWEDTTIGIVAAVNQAILSYAAAETNPAGATFSISYRGYPELDLTTSGSPDDLSEFGLVFIYCAVMFNFIVLLNQMAYYKQTGIRGMLKLTGVKDSTYMLSWFLPGFFFALYTAVVIIVLGTAFNLPLFRAHWGVVFISFFLFAVASVLYAMFISAIVDDMRGSVLYTMAIFATGLLFAFLFLDGFSYEMYEYNFVRIIRIVVLQFMPAFNFMRVYSDIFAVTRFSLNTDTGEYVQGPGFDWEDLYSAPQTDDANGIDVPAPVYSIYLLMMNIVVFGLLTWYCDNVANTKNARSRGPCFCLNRRYWRFRPTAPVEDPSVPAAAVMSVVDRSATDTDVLEEIDNVLNNRLTNNHTVRVYALTKLYSRGLKPQDGPPQAALKGVTFAAQRGQVLAITGPNGAGKTTLLNILSGLIKNNSGEAYVAGHTISNGMDDIQQTIGVCQQYDVHYKELTVREHLRMTAEIRMIPLADQQRDIDHIMGELDLTQFANEKVENLSGGTRRRLSVAMACLGDPQVILLDEPTSGLDPLNRSRVYALLDRVKQGRTVIMTTHTMEDAEQIADRILILVQGAIKGVGHPISLKSKYGAGYKIHVTTSNAENVRTTMLGVVAELKISEEGGALVFSVPPARTNAMPALCNALEGCADVEAWGVSQTTLMDVFMNLVHPGENLTTTGAGTPARTARGAVAVNAGLASGASSSATPSAQMNVPTPEAAESGSGRSARVDPKKKFMYGWRAVAAKNWALQRRRPKTNCCQICVSILLFVIIGPLNLMVRSSSNTPYEMQGDEYTDPCRVEWTNVELGYVSTVSFQQSIGCWARSDDGDGNAPPPPPPSKGNSIRELASSSLSTAAGAANALSEHVIALRDTDGMRLVGARAVNYTDNFWFVNAPAGNAEAGSWDNKKGSGMLGEFKNLKYKTVGYSFVQQDKTENELDDALTAEELDILNGDIQSACDYQTYYRNAQRQGTDSGAALTGQFQLCENLRNQAKARFPTGIVYFDTVNPTSLELSITLAVPATYDKSATQQDIDSILGVFNTPAEIVGQVMVVLHNAFVQQFTDLDIHFDVGFRDMVADKKYAYIDASGIIALFAFPACVSFLLPIFVQNMLLEKERRLTEMMRMMGLQTTTYWLINYAFNYAIYLFTAILFVTFGAAFRFHFFTVTNPMVYIVLLLLWGHVLCALAFFISALFSSARRAVAVTYILLMAGCIAQFILNALVYGPDPMPFMLMFLYPPFTFYRGIYLILEQVGDCSQCSPLSFTDIFKGQMGRVNGMLILEAIVYSVIGLYLDYVVPRKFGVTRHWLFCLDPLRKVLGRRDRNYRRVSDTIGDAPDSEDSADGGLIGTADTELGGVAASSAHGEDEDVARMRQLVARRGYAANCPLVLEGLTKTYKTGKTALKDLSLAVEDGECFCMLGPNGAGKSTLLSILTGLTDPTSGTAYVCGYDIAHEIEKAYLSVGVCPQEDILWPELTVRDHLLFYARLSGVPRGEDERHVDEKIREFGLENRATWLVESLPRGLARRLSVTIAFVGKRRVIFLDEPTNGLDPSSRLPIWEMINKAKQNHCIIMNTHSMDEAEMLATTVAVLSQGKLLCIGTRDYLRGKFGKGYRLEISVVNADRLGDAEIFVRSVVHGAELMSSVAVHSVFEVPRENLKLAYIFEQMDAGAAAAGIAHWTITQSSLDEVFRRVVARDEVE